MNYHNNNQDVIESLNDLYVQCDFIDQYGDCADSSVYEEAIDIASKSLEAIENIQSKISELKKLQMSVLSKSLSESAHEQVYLIGYISALSVVEGIIADET